MNKNLIPAEYLEDNLTKENLVILDASPPNTAMGKTSSISDLCIPNTRIFNLKKNFRDKESNFPNTIPPPAQFEQECRALGINSDAEIIIYDNLGIYTSPRVWWLFKTMGHQNVKVLDGGLPEWINQGGITIKKSDLRQDFKQGNFRSTFDAENVITFEDIINNIKIQKFLLVDARSEGRFNGTAPEPRKQLKSGSIPHSINIPYQELLTNGKFKTAKEIKRIFNAKINKETELVFSCGSGMTACIIMLASEIAYKESKFLYDGSWTEYAELMKLTNP